MNAPRLQEFQFYPTPPSLVRQLTGQYYGKYKTILEPSAGRGDIADSLQSSSYNKPSISVCEISADLRAILVSKGYRVIGTDFLQLEAPYKFDLIVMNPPFAQCANHVLKALQMVKPGGELAAVLPKSAIGKRYSLFMELNRLIDLHGKVEEIGAAFAAAERKTQVECVIVRLKKPIQKQFNPFEHFKPNEDKDYTSPEDRDLPAPRDLIRAIVSQYQAAMRALKTLHESDLVFRALVPDSAIRYKEEVDYFERVDRVKQVFWELVFERTKIGERTTSGYRKQFMEARERIAKMEFSEATIYEVLHIFIQNQGAILDQCIMDVFNQVTKYSRDNVIQHEQWATNKSHKITPKIIVPNCLGYVSIWSLQTDARDLLNDLDKALSYFGGKNGVCTLAAISAKLDDIRRRDIDYMQRFESPNFDFRVYKKGTIHLYFNDLKTLEMINRYAAERRLFTLGSGK